MIENTTEKFFIFFIAFTKHYKHKVIVFLCTSILITSYYKIFHNLHKTTKLIAIPIIHSFTVPWLATPSCITFR